MIIEDQVAAELHRLHQGMLVLPIVADARSARDVERLGATAVATSGAAVARALGSRGAFAPMDVLVPAVSQMARAVGVPVSVDLEGACDDRPGRFESDVDYIVCCGAVGIDLEDGPRPTTALARKIRAAKQVNPDLFLNARIDVYRLALVPEKKRLAETLKRARKYRDAGADGIHVPGLTDRDALRTLSADVGRPLTLVIGPTWSDDDLWQACGVRRLLLDRPTGGFVIPRPGH
jgi:2-methylisocitrate lyase-like PEP mutase family enzyme